MIAGFRPGLPECDSVDETDGAEEYVRVTTLEDEFVSDTAMHVVMVSV